MGLRRRRRLPGELERHAEAQDGRSAPRTRTPSRGPISRWCAWHRIARVMRKHLRTRAESRTCARGGDGLICIDGTRSQVCIALCEDDAGGASQTECTQWIPCRKERSDLTCGTDDSTGVGHACGHLGHGCDEDFQIDPRSNWSVTMRRDHSGRSACDAAPRLSTKLLNDRSRMVAVLLAPSSTTLAVAHMGAHRRSAHASLPTQQTVLTRSY